jgi:hypothetical protein
VVAVVARVRCGVFVITVNEVSKKIYIYIPELVWLFLGFEVLGVLYY